MFPLCLPDLRQTRARIFFWLGLLILPLFWMWWMNKRWFSRTERIIGWIWTGAYAATALRFHQELADYFSTYLSFGHPIVAMWITMALAIWFMGRTMTVIEVVSFFFILGGPIIHAIQPTLIATVQAGSPVHVWLLPLIPAILHLLITPDWGGLRKRT